MPRIIVTTDPSQRRGEAPVRLDERVDSVHLSSGLAAAQLIQGIAWAVSDAEHAERAGGAAASELSVERWAHRPLRRTTPQRGRRATAEH
jgi:hypothetical protein